MKWLRETRNISSDELSFLNDSLARFYSNPPEVYHDKSEEANRDWNKPDHIFHRKITDRAFPGAKILDVGCGPAMACPWFTEKGAYYTGVDLAKEQLNINKRKYPECDFLEMHWSKIPELGKVFDLVSSFFTLEHIVYPREFLKASAHCVKSGGFLAVLCPEYLKRGFLPSQHFFGRKPGGIKAKIKKLEWIEALIEIIDRYIIYPKLIHKARLMYKNDGAWLINLRPLCLETESWATDWDAVYMVGEDEVAAYIEKMDFTIIERGALLRKSEHSGIYPEFCYVLAQKLCRPEQQYSQSGKLLYE